MELGRAGGFVCGGWGRSQSPSSFGLRDRSPKDAQSQAQSGNDFDARPFPFFRPLCCSFPPSVTHCYTPAPPAVDQDDGICDECGRQFSSDRLIECQTFEQSCLEHPSSLPLPELVGRKLLHPAHYLVLQVHVSHSLSGPLVHVLRCGR